MSRKDYVEHVVAALGDERDASIVQAIVRNFGSEPRLAKIALRRAIRAWKVKKLREETS